MGNKKNILVLCTGNSCRSQMAEAYIRHFGKNKVNVYSAGIKVRPINPMTVAVMKEDGIDISNQTSNTIEDYWDNQFDVVLTVCDNAANTCPYFPGKVQRIHRSFFDPTVVQGTPEQVMSEFRKVRNEIKAFSEEFVKFSIS